MTECCLSRRGVLATAASVSMPIWGASRSARSLGPQPGDALVAVADPGHSALRPEAIQEGAAPVLAWPMDRQTGLVRDGAFFNQVLLLRLPAGTDAVPAGALVAFSAICQHAGCIVSGWIAQRHVLHCPCHGSEYDPARNGAVVAGPAPLPLPRLPVQIVDDVVTVAGPFSARPGGHTGRTD
jgi:rieske iron-sulfur protein